MLGSGVREIPTSMLQAPPPEFGSDQNNRKDFGGLVGGPPVLLFLIAMIGGVVSYELFDRIRSKPPMTS